MDEWCQILKEGVIEVMKNPSLYKDGAIKLYATSQSCPDPDLMDDMSKTIADCFYKTKI